MIFRRCSKTRFLNKHAFLRNHCFFSFPQEECHNYIRVILKVSDDTLLVCGTHAFKPKCRRYQYLDNDYMVTREFNGIAIAPFDPAHNATAIWTSGEIDWVK